MEFGWGLIIGMLSGVNVGVLIAGLLAGTKLDEPHDAIEWDPLHVDQAVWDDVPFSAPRVSSPLPRGAAEAADH
jgi:hypothetical protein